MSMDIYETASVRDLNKRLAVANKFDLNALMNNRQGVLAPSQMKIIYSRIKFLGFFSLVLVGGGIYQYIKDGLPEGYVAIAVYFLITGIFGYSLITALKNVSAKRVESMEGIGFSIYETDRNRESGHKKTTYYYQIGGARFLVKSEAAYYALINELSYRVYYLPGSKVLVNIETLQAPPDQTY